MHHIDEGEPVDHALEDALAQSVYYAVPSLVGAGPRRKEGTP